MRPLILLSNRLPLFLEINHHCNGQNWFVHNIMDHDKVIEVVNENDVAGLIIDLSTIDISATIETVKSLRNKITGPIVVIAKEHDKKEKEILYDLKIDAYFLEKFDYSVFISKIRQLFWLYDKLRADDSNKTEVKTDKLIKCDDLSVDFKHYRVIHEGNDIGLTPKEFSLFWYLMQHRGQVLSRDQLLEGVWGYDAAGSTRTIDIHISHLRDKLEENPQSPNWIKTVRGFGYILDNDYPLVSEN
ncbi:response regulator transcription factor [Companilactobacillus baiquanensis]|nr:response regulator transcription factor [Companilactobacillus baiquanensis]